MSASDLIDYFRLDAFYNPLTLVTRETIKVQDRTHRKRQVTAVKEWKRTRRIGRGAFGTVWLDCNDDEARAVKEIAKEDSGTSLKVDYRRELLALGRLSKYRNEFVHFHGWFEDDQTVFLAMEYLEHGDLVKYITPDLGEEDARSIIRQLLEGVKVLHGMNWVHRDLKPQNIFVVEAGPKWWVKIGDLGISRRLYHNQNETLTVIGSPDYLAPEISMPDALGTDASDYNDKERSLHPAPAVDLWSLGCVLYQLYTKQVPFSSQKSLKAYCKGKTQLPLEPIMKRQVSENGIGILQGLLQPRPKVRLTVTGAMNHAWFDNKKQESSDSSTFPTADKARIDGFSKALPESDTGIANIPMTCSMKHEQGSHSFPKPESSFDTQVLLEQEKGREPARTGKPERGMPISSRHRPRHEESLPSSALAASLARSSLLAVAEHEDSTAVCISGIKDPDRSFSSVSANNTTQDESATQINVPTTHPPPTTPSNSRTVPSEQPMPEGDQASEQRLERKLQKGKTKRETIPHNLSSTKPESEREPIKLEQNRLEARGKHGRKRTGGQVESRSSSMATVKKQGEAGRTNNHERRRDEEEEKAHRVIEGQKRRAMRAQIRQPRKIRDQKGDLRISQPVQYRRTWYGVRKPVTTIVQEKKSNRGGFLMIFATLATLAAILGLQNRRQARYEDYGTATHFSTYTESSMSSASSDNRGRRKTRAREQDLLAPMPDGRKELLDTLREREAPAPMSNGEEELVGGSKATVRMRDRNSQVGNSKNDSIRTWLDAMSQHDPTHESNLPKTRAR